MIAALSKNRIVELANPAARGGSSSPGDQAAHGPTEGNGEPGGQRMNRQWLLQLAAFVAILIALNYFFALHISIVGSLILTVCLSLLFSVFRRP